MNSENTEAEEKGGRRDPREECLVVFSRLTLNNSPVDPLAQRQRPPTHCPLPLQSGTSHSW
ncbi:hypothetical protein E2C01_061569 [Portunus trituberculatus]|uniref:Uncharacterized protein n=1 Tax=Portunus trituberculatus TaxID=210409 RepID=A0A5B7HFE7_PORTR|nr:hypothetical protein [Portunus trituberculatus]